MTTTRIFFPLLLSLIGCSHFETNGETFRTISSLDEKNSCSHFIKIFFEDSRKSHSITQDKYGIVSYQGEFPEELLIGKYKYVQFGKRINHDPIGATLQSSYFIIGKKIGIENFYTQNIYVKNSAGKISEYFTWDLKTSPGAIIEDAHLNAKLKTINYILGQTEVLQSEELGNRPVISINRLGPLNDLTEVPMASKPSFTPEQVKTAKETIDAFPIAEIDELALSLKADPNFMKGMRARLAKLKEDLSGNLDGSFSHAEDILNKMKKLRARGEFNVSPLQISHIKDRITTRFLKDFKENTTFNSFDEYVDLVMKIPEYRAIVEEMQAQPGFSFFRSYKSRMGVLLEGYKNMHETKKSMFMHGELKGNSYYQSRLEVESEALGISIDEAKKELPDKLRPKSLFFHPHQEAELDPNFKGEVDFYYLNPKKILEAVESGKLAVSITLGDSLRSSVGWQGRAIPLDLFPYFAAPFIHQSQIMGRHNQWKAIYFREKVYGTKDIYPAFLGNLNEKMKLFVTKTGGMLDEASPNTPVMDYLEAQFYGPLDASYFDAINLSKEEKASEAYMNALRVLQIKTNKD